MDANKKKTIELSIGRTIKALEKNNMNAVFLPAKADVVPFLKTLLQKGESISTGGSVSLSEAGVMELLRNGDYQFFDRYAPGLSQEEIHQVFRNSFSCDTYLASTNAVTEHGELYCVDGNGNRVAAMIYGPKRVILVVGYQKIVPSLSAAVVRLKTIACPANALRLGKTTHCGSHGICFSPKCDSVNLMGVPAGSCEDTFCSSSTVFGRQVMKGRITVILVGEELGY